MPTKIDMDEVLSADTRSNYADAPVPPGADVIPIEVKSDSRVSGKSLSVYNEKFKPKYRIRFSANNLKYNDGLVSIPISMADWTLKILKLLERQMKS